MSGEMEKQLKASGSSEDAKLLYESNYLRSIFPPEVWMEIFKWIQVLMPEDLENWSNSSPYFRHLLEDQRVTFLFPKVFDIMAPKYETRYPADEQRNNCYREDPVGPLDANQNDNLNIGIHPLTGIKKCRLVCRSWNKTIQEYYEDPKKPAGGSHFEMKYDQNRIQKSEDRYIHMIRWDRIDYWKNCVFQFYTHLGSPLEFAEHFEKTHNVKKNPFMGRSLKIRECINVGEDEEEVQVLLNGIDQALRNFGEEVWYFDTVLDMTNPLDFPAIYLMLKRWITMMPNLKTIQIVQYLIVDNERDGWNSMEPLNDFLPALERAIKGNPLPRLEKLEFISVKNLVAPIFNELIRQNDHIPGLEMDREHVNVRAYNYDVDFVLTELPNLKRLGIHSFAEEEFIKLEEKIGGLHLEKFQLTDAKGSPFHWQRLLGLMKGSSETLTDLVLELPFVGNKEGGNLLELTKSQDLVGRLEKLERLALFVGRPPFLDWLLPMKDTLKQLDVVIPRYLPRVKGYDKVVTEQAIELLGFEKGMQESNVWKAFGNLKIVNICKGYLGKWYGQEWSEFYRPE